MSAALWGMQDLSSPARDGTHALCRVSAGSSPLDCGAGPLVWLLKGLSVLADLNPEVHLFLQGWCRACFIVPHSDDRSPSVKLALGSCAFHSEDTGENRNVKRWTCVHVHFCLPSPSSESSLLPGASREWRASFPMMTNGTLEFNCSSSSWECDLHLYSINRQLIWTSIYERQKMR